MRRIILNAMCTPRSKRSARSAFTLIELLVCIAVIALLIAILVPSLAGAKRRSFTIVCQAQLRSLAASVEMYVQFYNSTYPDADAFPYGPQPVEDISLHDNCLAFRLHPLMPDSPTRVVETWYCPVKGGVPSPLGLRVFGHGTYPYNAAELFAAPTAAVARTSRTGLLRDYVALDKVIDAEADLRYGLVHERGQNVVYVDGHAGFDTRAEYLQWGPDYWPVFPHDP